MKAEIIALIFQFIKLREFKYRYSNYEMYIYRLEAQADNVYDEIFLAALSILP